MRNLITYEEISRLARPCSADQELAEAMIAEAQRVELKPRLGDALYLRVLSEDRGSGSDTGSASETIYYGGTATDSPDVVLLCTEDASLIIQGGITSGQRRFDTLVNGGRWTTTCGEDRLLTGIATALAYYALARIVRDGNIQTTTYGAVIKDDQYSAEAERTERQRQYRELFSQADSYMAEAIQYLTMNRDLFPEYKQCGKMRSNRTTIRIIGK